MNFSTNVDYVFEINKKAHAVIMSCTTMLHIEGAKNYVKNVGEFYSHIVCDDAMQKKYLVKSFKNIETVLKVQSRKIKMS